RDAAPAIPVAWQRNLRRSGCFRSDAGGAVKSFWAIGDLLVLAASVLFSNATDAIYRLGPANIHTIICDRGRGEDSFFLAHSVLGEQLECRHSGENVDSACLADDIDLAVYQHRRSAHG